MFNYEKFIHKSTEKNKRTSMYLSLVSSHGQSSLIIFPEQPHNKTIKHFYYWKDPSFPFVFSPLALPSCSINLFYGNNFLLFYFRFKKCFQLRWNIIDIKHCISWRCTTWWLDIHTYCDIITTIRLVSTSVTLVTIDLYATTALPLLEFHINETIQSFAFSLS